MFHRWDVKMFKRQNEIYCYREEERGAWYSRSTAFKNPTRRRSTSWKLATTKELSNTVSFCRHPQNLQVKLSKCSRLKYHESLTRTLHRSSVTEHGKHHVKLWEKIIFQFFVTMAQNFDPRPRNPILAKIVIIYTCQCSNSRYELSKENFVTRSETKIENNVIAPKTILFGEKHVRKSIEYSRPPNDRYNETRNTDH